MLHTYTSYIPNHLFKGLSEYSFFSNIPHSESRRVVNIQTGYISEMPQWAL